jgi:type VI secretion system secreted protein VgrG
MSDMQIEHTEDGECINLHSDKDISVMANNNEDITIVQNRTINVLEGTHTETIKGDTTIHITDGKLDHDVVAGAAKYHVKGAVSEKYDNKQETTVANEIIIKSTGSTIYVQAAKEITLIVGASKLWMDSSGKIELSGTNIAITGSEKVGIAGKSIVSEAKNDHTISGMLVVSKGSTTNTVQGGMVMLNP